MELLSEMRTSAQALNYALARERRQPNQKEILRGSNSNWNTTVAHLSARKTKTAILRTHNTKQYTQCWRCGSSLTPNNNNNKCPAKSSPCNICKKNQDTSQKCVDHRYPHFPKIEDNTHRDNKHKQEM